MSKICKYCETSYDLSQFWKSSRHHDNLSQICKICSKQNRKTNYEKYMRDRDSNVKCLRKENFCYKCGRDDYLEIKSVHDKKALNCWSKDELTKRCRDCTFICRWCNRLDWREQMQINKSKTSEKLYQINKLEYTNSSNLNGKQCNGALCKGNYKYTSCFYKKGKNSFHYMCKQCYAVHKLEQRELCNDYVNDLKILLGECELCHKCVTESTTCCFDFDHINRNNKRSTIANLISNGQLSSIKIEMNKCQLLCVFCHFDKTKFESQ